MTAALALGLPVNNPLLSKSAVVLMGRTTTDLDNNGFVTSFAQRQVQDALCLHHKNVTEALALDLPVNHPLLSKSVVVLMGRTPTDLDSNGFVISFVPRQVQDALCLHHKKRNRSIDIGLTVNHPLLSKSAVVLMGRTTTDLDSNGFVISFAPRQIQDALYWHHKSVTEALALDLP